MIEKFSKFIYGVDISTNPILFNLSLFFFFLFISFAIIIILGSLLGIFNITDIDTENTFEGFEDSLTDEGISSADTNIKDIRDLTSIKNSSVKAPLIFRLLIFTLSFSLLTIVFNRIIVNFNNIISVLYLGLLFIVSWLITNFANRVFVSYFQENSYAVSKNSLIGESGIIITPNISPEKFAEAKIKDINGQTHYVYVKSINSKTFNKNDKIKIVNKTNNGYLAEIID